MATDERIQKMVDQIVDHFAPLKVLLFGSRARGDYCADSDVDLIVVFSEIENKTELVVDILEELVEAPLAKDVIVATPEDIEHSTPLLGHVLHCAIPESQVLYDVDS